MLFIYYYLLLRSSLSFLFWVFISMWLLLMGLFEECGLQYMPYNLPTFKTKITEEIGAMPPDTLRQIMRNFQNRLAEIIQQNGHHLRDFDTQNLNFKCCCLHLALWITLETFSSIFFFLWKLPSLCATL